MASTKFTDEVDLALRAYIEEETKLVLPNIDVLKSPAYFDNVQDYASYMSRPHSTNMVIEYLMIGFGEIKNSKKKGCEHDPDVFITYEMQMFRRYYQSDDPAKSSHDILVKDFSILRNRFLNNMDISDGKVHFGIEQNGRMVKFRPCTYIGTVFGDWFNLTIQIEVTS